MVQKGFAQPASCNTLVVVSFACIDLCRIIARYTVAAIYFFLSGVHFRTRNFFLGSVGCSSGARPGQEFRSKPERIRRAVAVQLKDSSR